MRYSIDIERLRKYLRNHFGTAMISGFGMAVIELGEVEDASEEELINIATKNGIDLNRFIENELEEER